MHVHDSALQAAIVFAMVLIIGTIWRIIALHLSDKGVGKAMSVMY